MNLFLFFFLFPFRRTPHFFSGESGCKCNYSFLPDKNFCKVLYKCSWTRQLQLPPFKIFMNSLPFGPPFRVSSPRGVSPFSGTPPESGCKDNPFFIIPATSSNPFFSFNPHKLPIPLIKKVLYNRFLEREKGKMDNKINLELKNSKICDK